MVLKLKVDRPDIALVEDLTDINTRAVVFDVSLPGCRLWASANEMEAETVTSRVNTSGGIGLSSWFV